MVYLFVKFDFVRNPLIILARNKIKEGNAEILCELDDGVKNYSVNIKKIFLDITIS